MTESPNYEAEGLLASLEGGERDSRIALLERLTREGVELKELKDAVAEGRLAVLPVERALIGEPKYTPHEVAERSGVDIETIERQWRSIGIAVPDREAVLLSKDDLEAAHRQRALLDAGLDEDAIAELGRTIAVAMSQFAAASRQVLATTFAETDDTEAKISDRIYQQTETLLPLVAPTLDYVYRLHLREQLRTATLVNEAVGERVVPGSETVTVAFADLVGFTELGEELAPEDLGRVTGRLDEVARDVANGPVRLVKLIGDAAMFTCADTGTLLEAVLDLVDEMAEEGDGFPLIRAGVARGDVISRGGDYYGASVNLASRITGVARPGSVLTTKEVRDEVEDRFSFSSAGRKHLKGIHGTVEAHRCRDLDEPDEESAKSATEPEIPDEPERSETGSPRGSRRRRQRRARRS